MTNVMQFKEMNGMSISTEERNVLDCAKIHILGTSGSS